MATISNRVVWASNTAELTAALKLGLDQIVSTQVAAEKMVQALSGDKLIAAANKYTAAVMQMGGTAKLTEAEQARINDLLNKAIDKYEALGLAAPTAMLRLETATRSASKANEEHTGTAGTLGEALRLNVPIVAGLTARFYENVAALGAWGLAIGGVVVGFEIAKKGLEFIDSAAQDARLIRNLATETGIGVLSLQALSLATKDYGIDADTLARGIFQLSRKISGDDNSARSALEAMGISINKLKELAPEQQFLTVARALNSVQDSGTRATLAEEIFTARFAAGLLKIGPGLDDLVAKMKHSNEIIGTDSIEALAKYADQMDHLNARWQAAKAEGLLPLVTGINDLITLLRSGTVEQELGKLFNLKSWTAAFFGPAGPAMVGPGVGGFTSAAGTGPQASGPIPFEGPQLSERNASLGIMATRLATVRGELVTLTAAQRAWLASMEAIRPVTALDLVGTGISEVQVTQWKQAIAVQQELAKARAQAARDNAQADAMETDGLQNAISVRLDALDAEHAANVKNISLEIGLAQKKNADLLAENLTYHGKRRLLEAEGAAAVEEIVRSSDETIAKLQSKNKTQGLDAQLAAIDDEVAAQQRAALQKVGYTDNEWRAEYEIYLAGEERKQGLIDTYDKKEVDARAKLRAEIAGLDLQADTEGLARTLAALDAKQALELTALQAEGLYEADYQQRKALIDEKYDKERGNATLTAERQTAISLLAIRQQTEDLTINLLMSGMEAELAINEIKRQRTIATLILQNKGTQEWIRAEIAAENQLYDLQAQAIVQKFDPIAKAWKDVNADIRQTWADTWATALTGKDGITGFINALLSPFAQLEQAWLKLMGALVADWEGQFLGKLGFQMSGITGGPTGAGGFNLGSLFSRRTNAPTSPSPGEMDFMGPADNFMGPVSGASTGIGGKLVSGLTTAGISLAVGALIGPLVNWIKGIGGPSAAEKAGRNALSADVSSFAGQATQAEKNAAGPDQQAQALVHLQDAYITLGYDAQTASTMAQAAWKTMADASKQGDQAVNAAGKTIQDTLNQAALRTAQLTQGVDAITAAAQTLGVKMPDSLKASINALLQMQGLTDAQRMSLQALLADTKPNFAQLTDMASKYGITLGNLGPKFEEANIEGTAKQIFNDFTSLKDAGGDVGGILFGMSDEISKLVDDSAKFGTAIPDNMRPLIQNLIDAGKLLDANGNQITDITKISFESTPLDEGLKSLTAAINGLSNLMQGLPADAGTAADGIGNALGRIKAPTIHVGVVYDGTVPPPESPQPNSPDYYGSAGGWVHASGIQQFSKGGRVLPFSPLYLARGGWGLLPRGTDTVPAMLTPGELVLNRPQQQSLMAALDHAPSAGASVTVQGPVVGQLTVALPPGTDVNDARTVIRVFKDGLRDNQDLIRTDIEHLAVRAVAAAT